MTNCKNCGAPLPEYGRCEYCGTKNSDPRNRLRFLFTGNKIEQIKEEVVLYADDKPILVDSGIRVVRM